LEHRYEIRHSEQRSPQDYFVLRRFKIFSTYLKSEAVVFAALIYSSISIYVDAPSPYFLRKLELGYIMQNVSFLLNTLLLGKELYRIILHPDLGQAQKPSNLYTRYNSVHRAEFFLRN